jgi:hypothetical protein
MTCVYTKPRFVAEQSVPREFIMSSASRRVVWLPAVACVVAGIVGSGCGGPGGPEVAIVTGTDTLNGQPVEGALLQFLPQVEYGSSSHGVTDAHGHYEMHFTRTRPGVMIGKSLVRITSDDAVTVGDRKFSRQEVFPPEYNVQSEQEVKVRRGKNRIDFHIETDYQPESPRQDVDAYGGT